MEEEEFEAIIEEVFSTLPGSAPEQGAAEDPGCRESEERERDPAESGKEQSDKHGWEGGKGC